MKVNTGEIVMVTKEGFRKGMIAKVVNLSLVGDKVCALVRFDKKRWRTKDAWFWPADLVPAPAVDRLALLDE